jgi:hypothetical protein
MKPREMYSGAAPAAMGQMGQGLAEVGANIARTIQSGYQSMGEGLSKGIQSATSSISGAYNELKQAKTNNSIFKLMADDPQHRKMLGIENDEQAEKVKKTLSDVTQKYGAVGGEQFTKQFFGPLQRDWALGREYGLKRDIAIALSDPEMAVKQAHAAYLKAQADALNRKVTSVPGFDPTGGREGSLMDQPMGNEAPMPGAITPRSISPTLSGPTAEPVSGGVVGRRQANAAGLPVADANAPAMTNGLFTNPGDASVVEGDLSKQGQKFDPQAALVDATDSSIFSPAEIRALGKVGHDINSYNALGSLSDKYEVIKKARDLVNQGMAGEPSAQKKTRSR